MSVEPEDKRRIVATALDASFVLRPAKTLARPDALPHFGRSMGHRAS
jgi:hypothetical protein